MEEVLDYISNLKKKLSKPISFKVSYGDSFRIDKGNHLYSLIIKKDSSSKKIVEFVFHEVIEVYLKKLLNGLDPHIVVDSICQKNFNDYKSILENHTINELSKYFYFINNSGIIKDEVIKESLNNRLNDSFADAWLRIDYINLIEKIIS